MRRFPPSFLERVQHLSAAWVPPGMALPGGLPRRGIGEGLVFEDHREYTAGDDPRSIDWNATARLGEPFVKRTRREEGRRLGIVVDATASMNFGTPNKLDAAIRLAAAMGLLAVRSGARVNVVRLGGNGPRSSNLDRWAQARAFLEGLDAIEADAPRRPVVDTLRSAFPASHARRAVILLTDAYELEEWLHGLESLCASGHRPVLWQVFAPEEIHPPLEGALQLVDAEGGETRDLSWNDATRNVYQHRLEQFLETLERTCARHRIPWQAHVTDRDELLELQRFLRRTREVP